ncbi:MAG: NADH oxidase [Phycisphaera sp.]|nr:NADH oxidase [Phycisphaera sp.]
MGASARTIVIVGGVAGGASAAARARRCNDAARIILFERDEYVSFANCGLPYYIGGEITDRNKLLVATPEKFRTWFNVEVHTRCEVTGIDRAGRTVTVVDRNTGATFEQSYDRLILAPGATPIVPKLAGVDAANVLSLRNLRDTDRIKALVSRGDVRRAVVVGAGFIGLEMVEMLRRLDKRVALVELQPQVLPALDREMAHLVETELAAHGVELHLGAGLEAVVTAGDRATAVELTGGVRIDADVVILGIGVRPNTALAQSIGLALGATGGIAVNEHMQTDDPVIYAVGDAAEYRHAVADLNMRIPLAGPANRAGRVAGEHAATDAGPAMAPVMGTAIVRAFGVTAAVTGCNGRCIASMGCATRSVWAPASSHASYYPGAESMMMKLTYDEATGRVLGAQIVGGEGVDKRIDVLATAIRFGATVDDLTTLDLAYAPPFGSAKDPVHLLGFIAQNDRRGFDHFIAPDASRDAAAQLVDVRTDEEWNAGHLDGAVHIPLIELRARLGELDRARPVVTYCKGGQRSYYATRILRQHGFADARTLAAGWTMQQHVPGGG